LTFANFSFSFDISIAIKFLFKYVSLFDISMREGEPVVVGTLNIGPSGDAIILVVLQNELPNEEFGIADCGLRI